MKPVIQIDFSHGLGDAVQLTCVLQHLAKYRPEWDVDLKALRGKHTVGRGHCREFYWEHPSPGTEYVQRFGLAWWENYNHYPDCPNTKITNCLREVFKIEPDLSLMRYQLHWSEEDTRITREYLERIGCRLVAPGKFNAVAIHYEGNTSQRRKNLTREVAASLVGQIMLAGFVPIILDWDCRSNLPDQQRIFCPGVGPDDLWGNFGSGDALRITALIDQCRLMVGIDSGPQKVAGATSTETIAVWTHHHPVQFYDLCPNVLHLVPQRHREIRPANDPHVLKFFEKHYHYREYADVALELVALMRKYLMGEPKPVAGLVPCGFGNLLIRADSIEQDMVIVHDIYTGDAYRMSLFGDRDDEMLIVDIGAHIGCWSKMMHLKYPEATIVCVEACPENIDALTCNVGDFATIIQAACSYEDGDLALLNTVFPGSQNTGGSIVVAVDQLCGDGKTKFGDAYRADLRPLPKITLEEIMKRAGWDRIEFLKLDCEGSEFSILGKTPSLSRIRFIVGEWHGRDRWDALVAERFGGWDYGIMFEHQPTGMGNFHLANRAWPPACCLTGVPESYLPYLLMNLRYHDRLQELVKKIQPKGVVEIGVQAGYGTKAIFNTAPGCWVLGIDNDQDAHAKGAYKHAQAMLRNQDFRLRLSDSANIDQLPTCDLVVADGSHTLLGCMHDLKIASAAAPHILVDDYAPGNPVEQACRRFLDEQPGWSMELHHVEDGRQLAHLQRPVKTLRLAFPSGIGDGLWCLTKVQALMKREGADRVHITVCQDTMRRSEAFLMGFDFVSGVDYCDLSIIDTPVVVDGLYNYAPSQPGWHHRFDWLLQANGHLERGWRLEDWLPDLEINWQIAREFHFKVEHERYAQDMMGDDNWCVFYFGPEQGNTTWGHNRGPRWKPSDWVELEGLCRVQGIKAIGVGADWDRSYFERHLFPAGLRVHDHIGEWPIGRTFAVIKRARFVIGYQSGIVIFCPFLGVPAAGFWRAAGDSIHSDYMLSFSEDMTSAWVPPAVLERGDWLPLIYGRCSPGSILTEIDRRGWREHHP